MSALRCFYNVYVDELEPAVAFYRRLGLRPSFESAWYVQMGAPDSDLELGLLRRDHETVPSDAGAAGGGAITLCVDDVDELYATLVAAGVAVIEPPRDLFYGQRRMLLRDPAGTLVDVSTEVAADPEWAARVSKRADGSYVEREP